MAVNGVPHEMNAEVELHSGDLLTCGTTILNIFIRPPPPKPKSAQKKAKEKLKAAAGGGGGGGGGAASGKGAGGKDPTGQTRQLVLNYKKYVFSMPERAFTQ
eukprot:SAG22_NODE_2332_length_2707_cov_1.760353_2_plen_102_part_00